MLEQCHSLLSTKGMSGPGVMVTMTNFVKIVLLIKLKQLTVQTEYISEHFVSRQQCMLTKMYYYYDQNTRYE